MLRILRQHPRALASPKQHLAPRGQSATPQWAIAGLSTQAARCNKQHQQPPAPKADPKARTSTNPELPAFSLEGLGVSRNMRLVLYTLLGIYGTMETWFYCRWAYQWWYGDQSKSVERS